MDTYRVELEKEQLIFSAAHFITFAGNICESLHGHNYRLKCLVEAELDANHYVIDFIALRDFLLKVTRELDHKVLLPTQHTMIRVEQNEQEIEARFENRRWVFPVEDCVLLPVANTTAEQIAGWILERLVNELLEVSQANWRVAEIGVDENEGQWGVCRRAST